MKKTPIESRPVRVYQEIYDKVIEFREKYTAIGSIEDTVSFLVLRGLRGLL